MHMSDVLAIQELVPHKCQKKKNLFLDEMGHLHFLLDEMGLGIRQNGIR